MAPSAAVRVRLLTASRSVMTPEGEKSDTPNTPGAGVESGRLKLQYPASKLKLLILIASIGILCGVMEPASFNSAVTKGSKLLKAVNATALIK